MSTNLLNFNGIIHDIYWKPAGSATKKGTILRWPMLSARISLHDVPLVWGGQHVSIQNQTMFISLSVPRGKGEVRTDLIQGMEGRFRQGAGNFLLSAGSYNVWGSPAKGEIKANFFDFRIGFHQMNPMNLCIVEGEVKKQNDTMLWIEERYMVPGRGEKKAEWRARQVPVFLPTPMSGLVGHRVLIKGKLSSRMLDGTEFLHIISEEVHACLA